MNEVGYRFAQRHKWGLAAGIVLFGGMFLFCLFAAVIHDSRFLPFSLFWLVPLTASLIALRVTKRGHLFFGPDHVTQLGWRDQLLTIQSVTLVKWRPITRRVRLCSPQGKLTVNLDNFERPDQIKIIHELRTRCSRARHLGWPRFCHQHAVKLIDELSTSPPFSDLNPGPTDGEYLMSQKRFAMEWAIVSGFCSLGWLAFVGLAITDLWQLNGLFVFRQSSVQASAMAFVPILIAWIVWLVMVWRFPKEGRIRKKKVHDELDRKQIKRAKIIGIPIFVFGSIWTIASYFALESVFGFSQDVSGTLALLTLFAMMIAAAAIDGFLHEDDIRQIDFEPALNRWEQCEQAQLKIRRPRIPGRRQQDPFIIS